MSKNLLDNGTVLTLGLVGAVAAIGVAAKRGVYGSRATATQNVMERLRSQLNGQGFRFEMEDDYLIVDDGASVSIVAVDSPLRPDAQGPVDDTAEPTMVEVAKRKLDRNGNLVAMKILGEFPVSSVSAMVAAMRGGARGSRAKRAETFSVGDKVKHKREFLRSIGWLTNVPRSGVVRSVTDGFSGRQLLEVAWSDGTTNKIISPNVTHAGKVELL